MDWLDTRQATHRLGVKRETLYAYVSRGLLRSHRTADGRESRFAADEIEALARRGRPRQASRQPSLDIDISTSITEIDGHRVRFRGHDALELARSASFEQVAELLWTGVLPERVTSWHGDSFDVTTDRLGSRMRVVAALAGARPGADHRSDGEHTISEGRRLIATLVDSLPVAGDGRCPRLVLADGSVNRGTVAGRLWARLTPRRARPPLVSTLNGALVVLADHEMAASALAARVAASTRAGVHGVVAAGMGALSGPLHGGESRRARRLVERTATTPPDVVVDDALARYGRLPGFGQFLYPDGDPRARLLLELLRDAGDHQALDLVDRLAAAARRRGIPPPNVDLALATLTLVTDMADDAGEVIFVVSRTAGWVAHACEEYHERPLRFRPRATYVPGDQAGTSSRRIASSTDRL
jgi:citrate synthase